MFLKHSHSKLNIFGCEGESLSNQPDLFLTDRHSHFLIYHIKTLYNVCTQFKHKNKVHYRIFKQRWQVSQMILFRRIWLLSTFYYFINEAPRVTHQWIRKYVACTWRYKTIRLHNLTNHNTNLNDPWLRTMEHNSFQACWKLTESKTFNNYLCIISINTRI